MSVQDFQPKDFSFSEENKKEIEKILAKYPKERKASAVMPLLTLAQKQHDNWIPKAAMTKIAEILSIPDTRVLEVATFYTMYNLEPLGKHHIQVCTNLSCWLKGADDIVKQFEKEIGVAMGGTSEDNQFTLSYVECAGACVNAPVVQIGVDYYEDLTAEAVIQIVNELKEGKTPKAGPYSDRKCSEPAGGLTTLVEGGVA
ncbi:MAG: NADH-quinone oxidoreductase subunit NuoE [Alphaproteobacteria bacterium]